MRLRAHGATGGYHGAKIVGPVGTRRYRRLPIFWLLRKLTAYFLYCIEGISMGYLHGYSRPRRPSREKVE